MKVLMVDEQGNLTVQEVARPQISPYQALVRTISCGICNGTDGKIIHRHFKGVDQYPLALGHEAVGEIVEVGDQVSSYQKGDVVLLPFLDDAEAYASAWGGFSEYGVVTDHRAIEKAGHGPKSPMYSEGAYAQLTIPPSIDPVKAAMIITFREVLCAVNAFNIPVDTPILVYGLGPVGLSFVRFLRLKGLGPIVAVDIVDESVREALRMGADYGFNSKQVDVVEKVRSLFPEGLPTIIDAVGVNALINEAMALIAPDGRICRYGISPEEQMTLDWSRAPYNWSLVFNQWPSKIEEGKAHRQILSWLECGALSFDDFIGQIVPFQNILSAFDDVLNRRTQKKVIIRYDV